MTGSSIPSFKYRPGFKLFRSDYALYLQCESLRAWDCRVTHYVRASQWREIWNIRSNTPSLRDERKRGVAISWPHWLKLGMGEHDRPWFIILIVLLRLPIDPRGLYSYLSWNLDWSYFARVALIYYGAYWSSVFAGLNRYSFVWAYCLFWVICPAGAVLDVWGRRFLL